MSVDADTGVFNTAAPDDAASPKSELLVPPEDVDFDAIGNGEPKDVEMGVPKADTGDGIGHGSRSVSRGRSVTQPGSPASVHGGGHVRSLSEELDDREDDIRDLKDEIRELKGETLELRIQVKVEEKLAQKAEGDVKELSKQLREECEAYAVLKDRFASLEIRIQKLGNEARRYQDERDDMKQRIAELEMELATYERPRKLTRSVADDAMITDESITTSSSQASAPDDVDMRDAQVEQQQSSAAQPAPTPSGARGLPAQPILEKVRWEAPPPQAFPYKVDARGHVLDIPTWKEMFRIYTEKRVYVYGAYLFIDYLYGFHRPPAQRTAVQQYTVDNYVHYDWMAETRTALGQGPWRTVLEFYNATKRDTPGYKPEELGRNMQFCEQDSVGCRFVDSAWTLNMRQLRGIVLFEALSIKRGALPVRSSKVTRMKIDKILIQILSQPGSYVLKLNELGIMPADEHKPVQYDPDTLAESVTMDTVVHRMADSGVTIEHADDACMFARAYLQEIIDTPDIDGAEWSSSEAVTVFSLGQQLNTPDSVFGSSNELFPRHPSVPWSNRHEQAAMTEFHDWRHLDLRFMRRPADSFITKELAAGRGLITNAVSVVHNYSPYSPLAQQRDAIKNEKKNYKAHRNAIAEQRQVISSGSSLFTSSTPSSSNSSPSAIVHEYPSVPTISYQSGHNLHHNNYAMTGPNQHGYAGPYRGYIRGNPRGRFQPFYGGGYRGFPRGRGTGRSIADSIHAPATPATVSAAELFSQVNGPTVSPMSYANAPYGGWLVSIEVVERSLKAEEECLQDPSQPESDPPYPFVFSIIVFIAYEDCYVKPCGNWSGQESTPPKFADVKLTFTGQAPSDPQLARDFQHSCMKLEKVLGYARRQTPTFNMGFLLNVRGFLKAKILESEADDEPPAKLTIDQWPVDSEEARKAITKMKATHRVNHLPVYDAAGKLVFPRACVGKLLGALARQGSIGRVQCDHRPYQNPEPASQTVSFEKTEKVQATPTKAVRMVLRSDRRMPLTMMLRTESRWRDDRSVARSWRVSKSPDDVTGNISSERARVA
ncbi:hypothetical protein C8R43DRAFT_953288 [Mycena crocata]|nr:hypothetical protein C8R43DRAFT_953288 [Mycena crocata]